MLITNMYQKNYVIEIMNFQTPDQSQRQSALYKMSSQFILYAIDLIQSDVDNNYVTKKLCHMDHKLSST